MSHVQQRMCAVCRSQADKSTFFRIVKSENTICLDKLQKMQGRGVYLCKNAACISKAEKKKSINRTLSVNVSESFYEELRHNLNG